MNPGRVQVLKLFIAKIWIVVEAAISTGLLTELNELRACLETVILTHICRTRRKTHCGYQTIIKVDPVLDFGGAKVAHRTDVRLEFYRFFVESTPEYYPEPFA